MRVVITFAHVNIIVSWLVSHNVETAASVHLRRKPIPERDFWKEKLST